MKLEELVPGRCYESHPALKIGKFLVYGGSASQPKVRDAQVYISLQAGSTSGLTTCPWDDVDGGQVVEAHYSIVDMCAPRNPVRFKRMIDWVCNQLQEGKKVHIGCIGGHGRTGMVLAALVAQLGGDKDAITYVRKNYCSRAVESSQQVNFLHQHFGVKKVAGSKSSEIHTGSSFGPSGRYPSRPELQGIPQQRPMGFLPPSARVKEELLPTYEKPRTVSYPVGSSNGAKTITPVVSARNLWKTRK